ncbi:MAG: Dot/Icm type IV secretion system ATPase DotB [Gammaproteobacteria bacterium]|nr:Dot/Icm type IV secretion system ATPase DotB [Gammaproteobacteria bacterium]
MKSTSEFLYPGEPSRFTPENFDGLLAFATNLNASDVTLQTNEEVVAEVYGRLYKITKRKLTNTEVGDLLNSIYGPNGTTQLLSGQDVDTHYEIRPGRNERYRFRVNGTACQVEGHSAMQLTLRTIPNEPPTLASMNLPENVIANLAPKDGVVYVTGATGSGKTTLLAAVIRELSEDPEGHRKMLTYESPIEFVYDMVQMPTSVISQSEIPRHLPTFAAGVRNALRRKPRLILVGESRDPETIGAVIEAALTGHPVYTTLHSTGVAESIRRLVGSFSQEERQGRTIDIIETMRLIMWQQLVPTVDGKRVPLREFLVFDEEVRDKLLEVNYNEVTSLTRKLLKERGQPMRVDAERVFKEGLITERLYKVLLAGAKRQE